MLGTGDLLTSIIDGPERGMFASRQAKSLCEIVMGVCSYKQFSHKVI